MNFIVLGMICSKDGGVGFKRIDSLCKDAGIEYSYERTSNGFKFIICRPKLIGDVPDVIYGNGEALNVTEQTALAILKRAPTISREEIAERASKTVRTVQRALASLAEKGYVRRVGAKKNSTWEVLK